VHGENSPTSFTKRYDLSWDSGSFGFIFHETYALDGAAPARVSNQEVDRTASMAIRLPMAIGYRRSMTPGNSRA
jgi:hypothetical protein